MPSSGNLLADTKLKSPIEEKRTLLDRSLNVIKLTLLDFYSTNINQFYDCQSHGTYLHPISQIFMKPLPLIFLKIYNMLS